MKVHTSQAAHTSSQAALHHCEQCLTQPALRDGMERGASCCEALNALQVELLGHAIEQVDRQRRENERLFSLSARNDLFHFCGRARGVARPWASLRPSLRLLNKQRTSIIYFLELVPCRLWVTEGFYFLVGSRIVRGMPTKVGMTVTKS